MPVKKRDDAQRQDSPGRYHACHDLSEIRKQKVYIETYGCRFNFGDSLKLFEILKRQGCSRVSSEREADVVIVNTCTVIEKTERRMLRRLMQIDDRNLYVTGCMPEVQRDAILAVCTPTFIPHAAIRERYRHIRAMPSDPVGIVQIAEGCTGACTYCITRMARGPLKSAPVSEILGQIAAFGRAGAAEIQLTAQDTGSWGRDLGQALPDLLYAIGNMPGRFRIRVGMMNPSVVYGILDDLVDAFAADNLFSFIHVPVQSGSDRILRRMGRGYGTGEFEQIVSAFRRRYPEITVATDVIAGFPGETEVDFHESLDLIRRMRFSKVNVTRYSRRPLTPAFPLADLPDAVKKDRSRAIQQCAETISAEIHDRLVGNCLPFLVTEQIRKGSVMARTDNDTGIVLKEELTTGMTGVARITGASNYFLNGRRIPPLVG